MAKSSTAARGASGPTGVGITIIGEAMIELSGLRLGEASTVAYGGDTINTAVYLAREQSDPQLPIYYVTALGDDPLSAQMIGDWQAEGLRTDLVQRIPGKLPGLYCILTDSHGERRFCYWRESSAAREMLRRHSAASLFEVLRHTRWLYLTGITLAILPVPQRRTLVKALQRLRSLGVKVAFDDNYRAALWPSPAEAALSIETVLKLSHLALLSADDQRALWGADADVSTILKRVQAWGVAEAVLKDGARSCWVADDRGISSIPACSCSDPVDTTAAGDAFNAAYLAARIRGLAPTDAALAGHDLAARVIRHRGAISPRS